LNNWRKFIEKSACIDYSHHGLSKSPYLRKKHQMKKKNKIHRTKALGIYSIVLSSISIILLTATIVLTQVQFLYNTVNSVFGGERKYLVSGDSSAVQRYSPDYVTKKDVLKAANDFNETIVEEGTVLLKNEDNTLPLTQGSKITVFGKNSMKPVFGGSGSNDSKSTIVCSNVNDSLTNAGFVINPVIENYYTSSESGSFRPSSPDMGSILTGFPIGEASLPYSSAVQNSYSKYNDAAVVFISRIGGEGYDLPRSMSYDGKSYKDWDSHEETIPGARSPSDHYLQLDQNETDMIKEACTNFDKVVLVVNSGSPIELGFLDDSNNYAYNSKIKAALWLGHPGNSGLNALGKILSGEVNPSGRTADTMTRDFKEDPSWSNFGNNLINDGNRYINNGKARNAYFVEYREGIYVGYRYYETRGVTDGEDWYNQHVVYPFGYGLSYTSFDWSVDTSKVDKNLAEKSQIDIPVTVKNTGFVAGKDVVELYYTAPYIEKQIEKSSIVLGDFIKTDVLQPGESKTYTLSIKARDMASYDYNDANHNDFKGYELDSGTYTIGICHNAHTPEKTIDCTLTNPIQYTTNSLGNEVTNLFDDVSSHISEYLSRANNFANSSCLVGSSEESYRTVDDDFISSLTYNLNDSDSDPWYTSAPSTQSTSELSSEQTTVKLYDLFGEDYNDPKWDTLLDQLTVSQLSALISTGNYRTIRLDNISKPATIDADGPMGFAIFMGEDSVYDTCRYASESVMGCTWNKKLAKAYGEMIGNESLVGNQKGDGRTYSGWYAPAMNIHRSQFGGRNFEYYSEDSFLSGSLAANVVAGANEKGVYTFAKHFALNEQETNRDTTGLITWANEQSMRELYFKPFEMTVEEGKTTAIMSSFNRIGVTWSGGNYNLLTKLLREEWGFKGMVITDFNLKKYMDTDQMIRAGGDLNLSPSKGPSSITTTTDIAMLRRAAKNILYTIGNSNAMNGMGEGIVWGYGLPYWEILLIVADSVFSAGAIAVSGIWFFFKYRNKQMRDDKQTGELKND
jgi:beta-glucosidase